AKGVQFEYGRSLSAAELDAPTVFCGSAAAAASWLKETAPVSAERLSRVELLPLTKMTAFFPKSARDRKGFGMLFPRGQGVDALGVLFNDCNFEGRSDVRSESWIYRGVDAELLNLLEDRYRALGGRVKPLDLHVQHWPHGIPHYTVELEKILRD